jgi:hypothetical protein
VIDEHALGEADGTLRLNLHMHQHPLLAAVAEVDLHQLVHHAPAQHSIERDLLQLFVQELMAGQPVDLGMDIREEEGHELLEL